MAGLDVQIHAGRTVNQGVVRIAKTKGHTCPGCVTINAITETRRGASGVLVFREAAEALSEILEAARVLPGAIGRPGDPGVGLSGCVQVVAVVPLGVELAADQ